uniref:Uncharacterized protein n=1 Tax=Guillardia theta TaxID=55529 RepID=A0A7S4PAL6_GUITH|mmetsp:Transcript_46951/g.147118  ORF Transcript_46951/g.147118 Transcript_46951/m.147118 type:complete len:943 (+) Transcript_46951:381-3209(+)
MSANSGRSAQRLKEQNERMLSELATMSRPQRSNGNSKAHPDPSHGSMHESPSLDQRSFHMRSPRFADPNVSPIPMNVTTSPAVMKNVGEKSTASVLDVKQKVRQLQSKKPVEALEFLESLDQNIKWKCFLGVPPSQRAAIMLEMDESDRMTALDMLRPEERKVIEKFLEMKKGTAKSGQSSRPKRTTSASSSEKQRKTEITSSTPVEKLKVQADVVNDRKVVGGQQDGSSLEKRLFENARTSDAASSRDERGEDEKTEGVNRNGNLSQDAGYYSEDGVMISSSPLQRLGGESAAQPVFTAFSSSKPPLPRKPPSVTGQADKSRQNSVFEPFRGIDPEEMETISQKLSDMQQQIIEIEKLGEDKDGRRAPFGFKLSQDQTKALISPPPFKPLPMPRGNSIDGSRPSTPSQLSVANQAELYAVMADGSNQVEVGGANYLRSNSSASNHSAHSQVASASHGKSAGTGSFSMVPSMSDVMTMFSNDHKLQRKGPPSLRSLKRSESSNSSYMSSRLSSYGPYKPEDEGSHTMSDAVRPPSHISSSSAYYMRSSQEIPREQRGSLLSRFFSCAPFLAIFFRPKAQTHQQVTRLPSSQPFVPRAKREPALSCVPSSLDGRESREFRDSLDQASTWRQVNSLQPQQGLTRSFVPPQLNPSDSRLIRSIIMSHSNEVTESNMQVLEATSQLAREADEEKLSAAPPMSRASTTSKASSRSKVQVVDDMPRDGAMNGGDAEGRGSRAKVAQDPSRVAGASGPHRLAMEEEIEPASSRARQQVPERADDHVRRDIMKATGQLIVSEINDSAVLDAKEDRANLSMAGEWRVIEGRTAGEAAVGLAETPYYGKEVEKYWEEDLRRRKYEGLKDKWDYRARTSSSSDGVSAARGSSRSPVSSHPMDYRRNSYERKSPEGEREINRQGIKELIKNEIIANRYPRTMSAFGADWGPNFC